MQKFNTFPPSVDSFFFQLGHKALRINLTDNIFHCKVRLDIMMEVAYRCTAKQRLKDLALTKNPLNL